MIIRGIDRGNEIARPKRIAVVQGLFLGHEQSRLQIQQEHKVDTGYVEVFVKGSARS